LSCRRWPKVYVSIAVNAVPSRFSEYICGFLRFSAVGEPYREPGLEPHKAKSGQWRKTTDISRIFPFQRQLAVCRETPPASVLSSAVRNKHQLSYRRTVCSRHLGSCQSAKMYFLAKVSLINTISPQSWGAVAILQPPVANILTNYFCFPK